MPPSTYSDKVSDSKHASLSTSSVITVQGRDTIQVRSASPAEGALLAARAIKGSAAQHRTRRDSDSHDPLDGSLVISEGLTNLEPWSHSINPSASEKAHKKQPSSGHRAAMSDEREKPWRKSNNSPSSSPRATRESPRSSPSRFRPPSAGSKLEEYRPGRLGQKVPSSNSSRAATPTLGRAGLPKMVLPINDINASRPRVKSPLSPSVMRPLTPSTAGLLTPASGSEPTDYFGLGIAVTRDITGKHDETNALSPTVHSRYSSRRPKEANTPRNRNTLESPLGENGRSRTREKREKDKKTMLSKALEKANTAVLLDNASNFEGALDAYKDACKLLHQVMDRTSGIEDKRKLDAIRETYTNRIDELCLLQQPPVVEAEKQLPQRPTSNDSADFVPQLDALSPMSPLQHPSSMDADQELLIAELPASVPQLDPQETSSNSRTRDSFLTNVIREVEGSSSGGFLGPLWERSKSPLGLPLFEGHGVRSKDELNSPDAPPPLSPMRSVSPQPPPKDDLPMKPLPPNPSQEPVELEGDFKAEEPMSWLNTIDESDSDSCASSMHEGQTGQILRRKDLRIERQDTSTDFDAAFDAAVEAAYEDGYEPDSGNVGGTAKKQAGANADDASDRDDEETEMMDDLARNYMTHGFDFSLQTKSALPRESNSSVNTRSTWQSSNRTDRNTTGTSLSTLSEAAGQSIAASKTSHEHTSSVSTTQTEDASATLTLPATTFERPKSSGGSQILERRSHRLSGPSLKPLKIETSVSPTRRRAPSAASKKAEPASAADPLAREEVAPWEAVDRKIEVAPWEAHSGPDDARISRVGSLRRVPPKDIYTPHPTTAMSDSSVDASDLPSPVPRFLRGQKSIVSLREQVIPGTSDGEHMPPTPTSASFAMYSRRNDSTSHLSQRSIPHTIGSVPPLPETSQQGGSHLFDTTLGRAIDQPLTGSPQTSKDSSSPLAFEPCPDSQLLRPFWLLRAIGNTVTHPRGGYITTRLFMPREAWLNRSVKLKNVEDKVAACDLLTAALGRLGQCDTYDADAILEEVQTFEEVMERVQTMLTKKLGSEVGVQGINSMFKEADKSTGAEGAPEVARDGGPKTNSGKSYLSSWRKLRGKNSMSGASSITGSSSNKGEYRETSSMTSVPMTSFSGVEKRTAHRREALREAIFEGPLRDYMAAVARLCEGAQALDQIARQVEDPGLKHSSPTHVGLEFSIRHAAEFFGFYVCRFMLADVGTLIDKYVKRSSEWVLT